MLSRSKKVVDLINTSNIKKIKGCGVEEGYICFINKNGEVYEFHSSVKCEYYKVELELIHYGDDNKIKEIFDVNFFKYDNNLAKYFSEKYFKAEYKDNLYYNGK